MGMDAGVVEAVLKDWRSAPVEARLRSALGYIEKLTQEPEKVERADIEALHAAGLNDHAILEASYVVFLFSVMDRLADAFDFTIPEAHQVEATGEFLHKRGYKLVKLIR